MKILHCADLHLDSRMSANLTKAQARERQAELLHTFARMIKYAEDNRVEAVIIAGDLYDAKNISAAARNVVRDAILHHTDITFYYLRGNHDAESFLAQLEEVPDNLKLFGEDWTSYTADDAGDIVITGAELGRDNRETLYSTLSLNREKFNIVVLHGQETKQSVKDEAEVVNLRRLRDNGIDYLALGHVHSYKEGDLDSRGVYCYPGCLEGRGFDECGEHGFVMLDVNGQERTCSREFVSFAGRKLYTHRVDITGCLTTTDIIREMEEALQQADYSSESLLKIVLEGCVDVACEKNIEFLQKQLADSFYFVKIYDETRWNVDYNAFALDQSLKGEFVRTVRAVEDLSEEEKASIIRYGIQALAGEELT
ncbi:MAG: DNA repair exonuclease [Candidatus Gastranaerophilales bacterium]|nr:DNA repair exonuclease [Candidatus Gastranaerophilales bacterium]